MNKWQVAHEIGTRLACIDPTPGVLKLLNAARAHSPVIEERVKFAIRNLSPGVDPGPEVMGLLAQLTGDDGTRPAEVS